MNGMGGTAPPDKLVQVSDFKTFNNTECAWNGGAFFWVEYKNVNGQGSDAIVAKLQKMKGCLNPT